MTLNKVKIEIRVRVWVKVSVLKRIYCHNNEHQKLA